MNQGASPSAVTRSTGFSTWFSAAGVWTLFSFCTGLTADSRLTGDRALRFGFRNLREGDVAGLVDFFPAGAAAFAAGRLPATFLPVRLAA
jgi:hypothetical protein